MIKSYTFSIEFGLEVFSKSFSLCKNVISFFCEAAANDNIKGSLISTFHVSEPANFASKQHFQKINSGNNSRKQWKRIVWFVSRHEAFVFVFFFYFVFDFLFACKCQELLYLYWHTYSLLYNSLSCYICISPSVIEWPRGPWSKCFEQSLW